MKKRVFDRYLGADVSLYTLGNDELTVGVWDFGGIVHSLSYRGRDVCLGFNTVREYTDANIYAGAAVGRVANRIAGGSFTLGGKTYELTRNDGAHTNHGGTVGFDKRMYAVREEEDGSLTFTTVSEDGDQGFPGRLEFSVNYAVRGGELAIRYSAVSDKDTLWAPTCHLYFALTGESAPSIADTLVRINASEYTPCSADHIPTGEILPVAGTRYDFRDFRALGEATAEGGYDNNFVTKGEHMATAVCPSTGIRLDVYSDMPGVQLYTADGLSRMRGKTAEYAARSAFCLEPQFVPDAVHKKGFAVPVLKAGEKRVHTIRYKFSDV